MNTRGLDYSVVLNAHEGTWHIWTPDHTGGILGSGATEEEAKADAIHNLSLLISDLASSQPESNQKST